MLTFSKREEYGIVFVTKLAQNFDGSPIPLSLISRETKIPLPFLRQIALTLRHAGLLNAFEGKNGGYQLAKEPKNVSVADVLESLHKKKLIICCDPKNPDSCSCQQNKELLWKKLNRHYIKNYYHLTFDRLC